MTVSMTLIVAIALIVVTIVAIVAVAMTMSMLLSPVLLSVSVMLIVVTMSIIRHSCAQCGNDGHQHEDNTLNIQREEELNDVSFHVCSIATYSSELTKNFAIFPTINSFEC